MNRSIESTSIRSVLCEPHGVELTVGDVTPDHPRRDGECVGCVADRDEAAGDRGWRSW